MNSKKHRTRNGCFALGAGIFLQPGAQERVGLRVDATCGQLALKEFADLAHLVHRLMLGGRLGQARDVRGGDDQGVLGHLHRRLLVSRTSTPYVTHTGHKEKSGKTSD